MTNVATTIVPPTGPAEKGIGKFIFGDVALAVDIGAIVTSMVTQAPLVVVAILLLYILLDRRFNALERRVEAVEQRLGAVEGEVRGLRGEVRELAARVNNLEAGVGALATRLDAVEKATVSIAARLDALEKDVAAVKARLDVVEREVATIGSRLDAVEKDVATIKAKLGVIEGDLATVKARLDAVEKNVADLAKRQGVVEERLGRLESAFDLFLRSYHAYNHALLEVLAGRGVIQRTDVAVLRGYLRLAPGATSRYYTREVEKRLREILDKEVLDWPEVIELERISHLIYKEWEATKRYDLLDYYIMLSIFISITKGHLLAEGKEPPDMAYAFTRPPPPDP